jgi:hypothetical protein
MSNYLLGILFAISVILLGIAIIVITHPVPRVALFLAVASVILSGIVLISDLTASH